MVYEPQVALWATHAVVLTPSSIYAYYDGVCAPQVVYEYLKIFIGCGINRGHGMDTSGCSTGLAGCKLGANSGCDI